MSEISKRAQPKAETKPEDQKDKNQPVLEENQLDQVTGGAVSLYQACATGKHISKATITG